MKKEKKRIIDDTQVIFGEYESPIMEEETIRNKLGRRKSFLILSLKTTARAAKSVPLMRCKFLNINYYFNGKLNHYPQQNFKLTKKPKLKNSNTHETMNSMSCIRGYTCNSTVHEKQKYLNIPT